MCTGQWWILLALGSFSLSTNLLYSACVLGGDLEAEITQQHIMGNIRLQTASQTEASNHMQDEYSLAMFNCSFIM